MSAPLPARCTAFHTPRALLLPPFPSRLRVAQCATQSSRATLRRARIAATQAPPEPAAPSATPPTTPPAPLTTTSASPSSPPPPTPPPPPPERPSLAALALPATALVSLAIFLFAQTHHATTILPDSLDMPTPSSTDTIVAMASDFIAGPHFAVSVGMGLSALIQALTGFGFAIVSVGALTQIPWIAHSSVFNSIQPVAATLGALSGWILILPELRKVKWKALSTLLVATSMTTPLGALMLEYFDPNTVIRALGALISGYVLYSVLGVEVPKKLGGTPGAWGLGFLAGALGGAFDITGPPLVVHGEAAGWDSSNGEFRRNVLAVVSVNSTLVVLWDYITGRLDDYYYLDFVTYALPTTLFGLFVGKLLSERMNPATFKTVVLGTCLIMGVKLLFS